MNITRGIIALALFGATLVSVANADTEPVLSELKAFEVVSDEEGNENFSPAERVDPGAVIEYQLTYTNTSDESLSRFVVNGRIPQASEYLMHSADVGQKSIFEARTDDIEWSIPPLRRMVADEAGILRPETVPPKEYAGIRWRLNSPLAAGEEVVARYRVRVDR